MSSDFGKCAALAVTWGGVYALGHLAHYSGHLTGTGLFGLGVAAVLVSAGILQMRIPW